MQETASIAANGDPMDAIAALGALGLSDYEARTYVVLVRQGALTGYEVAKHSGIPRANAYSALERLERRHMVAAISEDGVTRYAARPPSEFLDRMRRERDRTIERASSALARLKGEQHEIPVINLRGYETALERAAGAVDSARHDLLLALHPPESKYLMDPVERAMERGVDVTTLCMAGCETECGACRGQLYRYTVDRPEEAHWLLVVADRLRVIASEVRASGTSAIDASQTLIAELAGAYIRNTIALAKLLDTHR